MLENLKRDLARYGSNAGSLATLILCHGSWASVGYRFARFVHTARLSSAIRWPLRVVAALLQLAVRTLTNIDLPWNCRVGPGLYIPHTGYVIVGSGSALGENVVLTPGVVLGHARGGENSSDSAPRLGDRVYVGPGAKLIGPVEIGEDALIAVGAVVTCSIPPRAVVAGNPARVIGHTGSFEVVRYPGMEADPARLRSIELSELEREAQAGSEPSGSLE